MGDPSKGLSGEFSLMLNSSIKPYAGNYPRHVCPHPMQYLYIRAVRQQCMSVLFG